MTPTTGNRPALHVEVDNVSGESAGIPAPAKVSDWCIAALAAATADLPIATIAVRIVAAAESRELNRTYRDRDAPTNVLAFPAGLDSAPPGEPLPLGDLVICAPLVREEAAEQDKAVSDHWCHLVVHGTLHLVGFDHQQTDEADAMEALERQILESFAISDPYQFTHPKRKSADILRNPR